MWYETPRFAWNAPSTSEADPDALLEGMAPRTAAEEHAAAAETHAGLLFLTIDAETRTPYLLLGQRAASGHMSDFGGGVNGGYESYTMAAAREGYEESRLSSPLDLWRALLLPGLPRPFGCLRVLSWGMTSPAYRDAMLASFHGLPRERHVQEMREVAGLVFVPLAAVRDACLATFDAARGFRRVFHRRMNNPERWTQPWVVSALAGSFEDGWLPLQALPRPAPGEEDALLHVARSRSPLSSRST